MRMDTICTLIPIYYGVGYCVVYLLLGLSTTFCWMNESQLHTFFVYILNGLMELQAHFYLIMTQKLYESPEVEILEILTEGILCGSDNSNETLEENEGIW